MSTLKNYVDQAFPNEWQQRERKYAEKLRNIIRNALPDWNHTCLYCAEKKGEQNMSKIWQAMKNVFVQSDMTKKAF
ncbi:hypothetical protein EG348_16975 [Chryseobacterium sp. G0201]|nr:hypothetical protein EG348_16975 [Chryseobacterium sp. G0201]